MAGAAIAKAGFGAVILSGLLKIAAFIVLSPLLGLVLGFVIGVGMTWLFHRSTPRRVDFLFRKGQLLSAALYSLGHGTNNAQKTMGILALLFYTSIWKAGRKLRIPFWIVLICHAAMGLGTLLGGWRIVKTMGSKITKLDPFGGFCAESGGRRNAVRHRGDGHPRQHHPHHRRLDRRLRHQADQRRTLGDDRQHRLGLGADDSRRRLHRGGGYLVVSSCWTGCRKLGQMQ